MAGGRRSVAQGPSAEDQCYTLNAQVAELQTKLEALEVAAEAGREEVGGRISSLEARIDDTLTESISVLKQDYEQQVGAVGAALAQQAGETGQCVRDLEARLQHSLATSLDLLSSRLTQQVAEVSGLGDSRQGEVVAALQEVARDVQLLGTKSDSLNQQLDDVQEKMYDFEQNKRNNLIFYGVPGEERENRDDLRIKILNLMRLHLNMRREVPISKASRMYTGPQVQGCRPVLVTFESFKDREDVLKNSKVLRRSAVTVTEDLSKRTRESRQELRKFMRSIKKSNPERGCFLEYDRLYIDHKCFIWNDIEGKVVEMSESEKALDPCDRQGYQATRSAVNSRAGRPGLLKGYSVSSPNVAALGDDGEILDRIRELELQICSQQETISTQQRQIAEFTGKDGGYTSASSHTSNEASPTAQVANINLCLSMSGELGQ